MTQEINPLLFRCPYTLRKLGVEEGTLAGVISVVLVDVVDGVVLGPPLGDRLVCHVVGCVVDGPVIDARTAIFMM